ncbi:hypothetical protein PoB_004311600 [Plakobranchus ocellatus]|uniref:Uncharacterized protein n=1 Tax=Plakobranchus ocellatus TaxID=259542 RepID=A0AAV4B838_9GAST|nr:hypothetical protein PoB_004311600 [Plakobranchus ocellatus]
MAIALALITAQRERSDIKSQVPRTYFTRRLRAVEDQDDGIGLNFVYISKHLDAPSVTQSQTYQVGQYLEVFLYAENGARRPYRGIAFRLSFKPACRWQAQARDGKILTGFMASTLSTRSSTPALQRTQKYPTL